MSDNLADLVREVKAAGQSIVEGDARINKRMDGFESSLNELYKKLNRPGAAMMVTDDEALERKRATEFCKVRRATNNPKVDGNVIDYEPSPDEITTALNAQRGIKAMLRHGQPDRLDTTIKKSLSSFTFGTNMFLMPPTGPDQQGWRRRAASVLANRREHYLYGSGR